VVRGEWCRDKAPLTAHLSLVDLSRTLAYNKSLTFPARLGGLPTPLSGGSTMIVSASIP